MTPLIRFSLAWLAGIMVAERLNPPWALLAWAALPVGGAILLYRQNPRARQGAILALAFLAGAFYFLWRQPVFTEGHLAFYNDTPAPLTLTGQVVDEPDIRDTYTNLRLQAESIRLGDFDRPVTGLLLLRAPRYPQYAYGDRLTVTGQLETPPVFTDFSYKDYLARFGVYSLMRRPRISLIETGQGQPFWAAMFAFKARAAQTINRILAEPHASLLNGILLGIETGIPAGLKESFNLTGTSHVIVISGSNISLLAGILLLLGVKLVGRRLAPPLAMMGIILYTLLVGADAAVSRAAFMGGLWVLAVWVGRPGLALNSLFFSALALTLLNPLILWDVGFQLSFMATLGLILLVPPLEQGAYHLLTRRLGWTQVGLTMALFSELIVVTLAAQISTTPLILYHFGRLSLVSLLTNLLILPAQPPIMGLGAIATLAGLVWLPLGQALGWLVWLPLAWTVIMVEATARLPLASLEVGAFPLALMALFYAAIGAGLWAVNRPKAEQPARPAFHLPEVGQASTRLWVGGAAVGALLVWLAVLALPDGRLHVAFMDVGQGDAILITTPEGQQILIDGGPSPTDLAWRLGQQMPFWDHSLNLIINTHPDADHLAGLVPLLERYQVEQVLVSDAASTSALYREWQTQLAAAQLTPTAGQANMQFSWGSGVTATLLNPGPASRNEDEANNHSVVMRLQFGRMTFLLPGDIEAPVEQRLAQSQSPLNAVVFKSPHHGSKTSSSETFLEAVNPQVVVISVGQDNTFGHPSADILTRYAERGLTVLRTDERGTIEFTTDGQQLWVETAR